jgi:hypothetical protein
MPGFRMVQVSPSGLVTIELDIQSPPTATNCSPSHAMSFSGSVRPEAWLVQFVPSGLVRIVPKPVGNTKLLPFHPTPPRW